MDENENGYAPGMRVTIRSEQYKITKVTEYDSFPDERPDDDYSVRGWAKAQKNCKNRFIKQIECIGLTGMAKGRKGIFYEGLETIDRVDPAQVNLIADDSSYFEKSRVYIESLWRQQVPTDTKIHIGHMAAMDALQYQLEPAYMSLNQPQQRILIADAVGLGKTLEAGILMSELILRGRGRRILVVTVKSMLTQFQKEMWNRFTIPLVRLDSERIDKIKSDMPGLYNPFNYYNKTIISMDTLKNDRDYREHLEKARWDIIVIDEAHNVADRASHAQRSKLAKLLATRSDILIMLTATPHDGRSESFASLIDMLDPTAIVDKSNYTKQDVENLCIRRFRNDIKDQVSDSFKQRILTAEKCDATAVEEVAFDLIAKLDLEKDKQTMKRMQSQEKPNTQKSTTTLYKTILEKAIFSSPMACIETVKDRLIRIKERNDKTHEYDDDIIQLNGLKEQLEKIAPESFSRYIKLLKLLNDPDYAWTRDPKDRIVIFTERIATM
ncbi:MAG: DEAD/DEAH box helicase, partial [Christensenellaceae bacterium]|nr:DEAD/DEAH box helicase [Christensenellaceae bacterium]